jgi:hypothetical protein
MHAVADAHDTPFKVLIGEPVGLGVDCTAQLVPIQRSANVT